MTPESTPRRIQRKRVKGWRMPNGAVYVGRPTKWGNPFRLGQPNVDDCMVCATPVEAVAKYRSEIETFAGGFVGVSVETIIRELRGKDLACWCQLAYWACDYCHVKPVVVDEDGCCVSCGGDARFVKGQPCHADVLLELANREPESSRTQEPR